MREWVSGQSSGYRADDGNTDVVMLNIYGPRGGTKCIEVLTVEQATSIRDQITAALDQIAAGAVPDPMPGSVSHMPDRNSDDAVDENGCPTW